MNWMGDQPRIYCLEDSCFHLSFFFFSYLSLFYWPLLFLNEYSKTYSVLLRPPDGKERCKCACKPDKYNELKLVFILSAWESAEFIVGLPQLKDRYFRDISNVLTVTSRDETHFRHTQSTEANLSAKWNAIHMFSTSIFALILKLKVQITSIFSAKYFSRENLIAKPFLGCLGGGGEVSDYQNRPLRPRVMGSWRLAVFFLSKLSPK